jgi:PIN domain nuclease of toxin-antitoxin system
LVGALATVIHLDTHVLVWLFGRERTRIPEAAQRRMEAEELGISPMVELELSYLWEVGKVSLPAREVLDELVPELGLTMSSAPFQSLARAATGLRWTRDPFDRLIVAQALIDDAPLLTADGTILANFPLAVWDAA